MIYQKGFYVYIPDKTRILYFDGKEFDITGSDCGMRLHEDPDHVSDFYIGKNMIGDFLGATSEDINWSLP
jgi:hypothetical protein